MPCYDPRTDKDIAIELGVSAMKQIKEFYKEKKYLVGALCAIITELEKKGIANDIISQASKSGLVDIMSFWLEHKNEDEVRIAKEIHEKFSEHELEIVKKLLLKK